MNLNFSWVYHLMKMPSVFLLNVCGPWGQIHLHTCLLTLRIPWTRLPFCEKKTWSVCIHGSSPLISCRLLLISRILGVLGKGGQRWWGQWWREKSNWGDWLRGVPSAVFNKSVELSYYSEAKQNNRTNHFPFYQHLSQNFHYQSFFQAVK